MTQTIVTGADEERLIELGRWLRARRPLWVERPFLGLPVAWEEQHLEVSAALRALPLGVIERHEARPWELPGAPAEFRRWADEAARWFSLPLLAGAGAGALEEAPRQWVPGRKWEQIQAFVQAVRAHRAPAVRRWLDWCAGKGHLGRTLSITTGLPVTCVERDSALCHEGDQMAIVTGVDARFVTADVLVDDGLVDDEMGEGVGVVALHACGELHCELLRRAAAAGVSSVAVAPCCYHRFLPSGEHRPMSRAGQRAALALEPGHLRLVGLCEVVATPRRSALRRREQAFRLGLDLLLRQASGEDRYRPLGPAPRAWVDLDFEAFCRRLSERAGVELGVGADFEHAERWGWERLRLVRALGMVRGLFRGPLEAWLLLDRALFLVEQGFEVELGRFCDEEITPRSAALLARR